MKSKNQSATLAIAGRWAMILAMSASVVAAGCSRSNGVDASNAAKGKPNVLVILADDLGYADLSGFGSEIQTPNIDALMSEGRVLTNFHATPLCATSRSELLTGVDHHLIGVGAMSDTSYFYPGNEQYQGVLNDGAPTVAQILRDAGYHTYMSGKWHLGGDGPNAVGFEQSFAMDYSAAFGSNFKATSANPESSAKAYLENGKEAEIPDDFFSSDYFVDKLLSFFEKDRRDGKPFFAYLAFQAVHFPLQAPDKYLDLYKGKYDAGYQVVRDARITRMKSLGIIPQDFNPNPGSETTMIRFGQPGVLTNPSWDSLSASDKQSEARLMEVYAGMLVNLDDNVGRVIKYLKKTGQYDNTLVIFTSDNGADGMGYGFIPYTDLSNPASVLSIDNSLANYGKRSSFLFRSTRWAEVGTAPFRLFKSFTAEGGTAVPTIMRVPKQSGGEPRSGEFATLRDVVPTILAYTDVAAPGAQYQGKAIAQLEGTSLKPLLQGKAGAVHGPDEVIADEVNDIRVVRKGSWKMTQIRNYMLPSAAEFLNHNWQLYNMDTDRGENVDVAAQHPEIVAELTAEWDAYAQRVAYVAPLLPPQLPALPLPIVQQLEAQLTSSQLQQYLLKFIQP
ncbi:arylsulfatase [Stenotrophobium rhamnosiphilum]|uniref:Arylsulfatase n=1 Tax=Stenotrophobium rhamnosiphilum TaxID=2029166 RepID=A0A2T5MCG6_9GAMM|nr:arylsulfatase [Stenotrophobium rhamnosiphilum]PTU30255.1 arylsulfatase [Stenotrophobium rhamnosiphilum]